MTQATSQLIDLLVGSKTGDCLRGIGGILANLRRIIMTRVHVWPVI